MAPRVARRTLILGLIAAPAVVRAASLMAIRPWCTGYYLSAWATDASGAWHYLRGAIDGRPTRENIQRVLARAVDDLRANAGLGRLAFIDGLTVKGFTVGAPA